nr:immunoglobulin heavy chain junction region [Macaca mulatta]MOW78979.1 immunoglobulin heavy chain junction region [Macaca mulatta]MOW82938.1 immunoglobulin heavy chain junction region [Macaca mulatta]MOW83963.1 immunoglobulin heavy chain junction region [Macaca mulatta]MOW85069.1 immunoglobulin heavy chain junction region [Macaca mulatta]
CATSLGCSGIFCLTYKALDVW